ncbi:MAG TPA: CPBP family intramembrane glutamic endopeptidase [Bryobacteraceae bacterium]|nr:CPBP family intramembrane glutamic endopeptidase [Bryobacteraceae bacterium]
MSSSEQPRLARWLACAEALVIFGLIIFYIWWMRFRYPRFWILILALVIASHVIRRESLSRIGFGLSGAGRCFADLWPSLAFAGAVILALGLLCRSIRQVSWEGALSALAVYLVWGLFQQYLLNGYFLNRLSEYARHQARVPPMTAILFSLAHTPNWFLMLASLAGGYICGWIFFRYRNLYFLGVAHGVIGFLLYLTVPDSISHHLYVGPKWFF